MLQSNSTKIAEPYCIDAMGHVFPCSIHPLGGQGRPLPRHMPLAVAGSFGCHTRCRPWYDSPSGNPCFVFSSYIMTLIHIVISQTLSRLHVCATLAFSQIIGSICVMVARATAPNRIGPSSVFPDAGTWDFQNGLKGSPMASAPFWIALASQLIIVVGYFWFYRREQLCKSIVLFPRDRLY